MQYAWFENNLLSQDLFETYSRLSRDLNGMKKCQWMEMDLTAWNLPLGMKDCKGVEGAMPR